MDAMANETSPLLGQPDNASSNGHATDASNAEQQLEIPKNTAFFLTYVSGQFNSRLKGRSDAM